MSKNKRWFIIGVICVLGLAQLACVIPAAIRGGGWIPSGNKKATFGFQITCNEDTGKVRGKFQYNDHAEKVAFHGLVRSYANNCRSSKTYYQGRYTPQPKNLGPGGIFKLWRTGSGEDPCFKIRLYGGVHGGYRHQGCLSGGNVTIWE